MDEAFAKSFATICTIFSNAHCDEFIHPEYLSRFYYVLQQGLRFYQGDEVDNYSFLFTNKILLILATFSNNY
jgi:hypothetical protein